MTFGWQHIPKRGTDLKALPAKILTVIKILQTANRNLALPNLVVFLCACKSEGLTVKELAFVSGLNAAAVSRALRTLCDPECTSDDQPDASLDEPLLYLTRHPQDGRRHVVCLTEAGRDLRDQIDFVFSDRNEMMGRRPFNAELAAQP